MVDLNRYSGLIKFYSKDFALFYSMLFLFSVFFLVAPSFVVAETFSVLGDRAVAQKTNIANSAYDEGRFDEALKGYSDVQLTRPESPELQYNIGNVHYRKGNYEEAKKAYEAALLGEDKAKKAAAFYNMGNTLFREGSTTGAMDKLEESIDAYKKNLLEASEHRNTSKDFSLEESCCPR